MTAYYNDNNLFVSNWLQQLITAGRLPRGVVDNRPIGEVRSSDVLNYTQCHFFAGVGGWPEALRLAGWPENEPVWTGSCPCQPFSNAGSRRGDSDERNCWPDFYRLIAECEPPIVFGEQVASPAGRVWMSGIRTSLEDTGYAVGIADLCAAGVGSPQLRQRLFWVAYADGWKPSNAKIQPGREHRQQSENRILSFWGDYQWLECNDGFARRIEPGVLPLVDGVPSRLDKLHGYGNAIVPEVAAVFIRSVLDVVLA